jgi:hypothetical protein
MDKLIINDLSIKRQAGSIGDLNQQLVATVKLISSLAVARELIRCSRNLINSVVCDDKTLIRHVVDSFERDSRLQIMTWLTNHGPFWDDTRTEVDFDSFNYEGINVTEQGLGEAGRLQSMGVNAWSYSFKGGEFDFSNTPIPIAHSLEDIVVGNYDIDNIWDVGEVSEKLKTFVLPPASWEDMLKVAVETFKFLIFLVDPHSELISTPFSRGASERIFLLLSVLDKIAQNTNDDGSRNESAKELYDTFFVGEKPAFTDESDSNKNDFKRDLTFVNSDGKDVFAPWHGKINSPKIRIHFEWPRPTSQKIIKILFIGPKLTKK